MDQTILLLFHIVSTSSIYVAPVHSDVDIVKYLRAVISAWLNYSVGKRGGTIARV